MAKFRFWFLVYPDINKPIGGVKQIHRVAEALSLLGHEAYLVQDSFEFHPGWFRSSVNTIDKVSWDKVHLDPGTDFIVIAETFLPILKTLRPEIKKLFLIRMDLILLVFLDQGYLSLLGLCLLTLIHL